MTPYEFIGWTLINTSAVTNIVGVASARTITHGLRPRNDTLPSINYLELGGGNRFSGYERQPYSISCRASTAAGARDLNRVVTTVFSGAQGTGITGRNNGFTVERGSIRSDQGLIPESDDKTFNAPVDFDIIYAVSTVS